MSETPLALDLRTLQGCPDSFLLLLTRRIPSASMTTVHVPGFRTKGSTKLFWGTLMKVGSELGAKTICLDWSEPNGRAGKGGCVSNAIRHHVPLSE